VTENLENFANFFGTKQGHSLNEERDENSFIEIKLVYTVFNTSES
jgi:hypothetical protein